LEKSMDQENEHPEIPQLKKTAQKKERKGGAAAGSSGAGGGTAAGAGGGSILGGASPVGSSKTAATVLRWRLGEFLSVLKGNAALGVGALKAKLATAFLVAAVAGGGYVGYSVIHGVKNPGTPKMRPPGLSGIVSSIIFDKKDPNKSPSLYHASKAAKGLLRWVAPEAVAAADAAAEDEWEREQDAPSVDGMVADANRQS